MRASLLLLTALLACGNDPEPIDRSDLDLTACPPGETSPFPGLSPTEPVDYLELRQDSYAVALSRGEPCGSAIDGAACEEARQAVVPPQGWQSSPDGGIPAPYEFFIFTRGDTVGTVGAYELQSFLTPFETEFDAAFLAQIVTRGSVDCARPAARRVTDGFEVVTTSVNCGGARDEFRVLVNEAGETTVLESVRVAEPTIEMCP